MTYKIKVLFFCKLASLLSGPAYFLQDLIFVLSAQTLCTVSISVPIKGSINMVPCKRLLLPYQYVGVWLVSCKHYEAVMVCFAPLWEYPLPLRPNLGDILENLNS